MEREKFSSRLGFILISAGCAIGLGNVWRFPYIVGEYGGAAFVLIYLVFLIILGLPVAVMEFAVGRASQKSIAMSYEILEPKGTKWHYAKYPAMIGNYILMMFYTTVSGWMVLYFFKMMFGDFNGLDAKAIEAEFNGVLDNPVLMIAFMILVVILGFAVCAKGLQNGVEKITKVMMLCLLLLIVILVINSVTMENSSAGLEFYLKPNFDNLVKAGLGNSVFVAMGQAFFTLSIGIGSLGIFGSYIGKERRLTGEAISIMVLDTFVAIMAGLIIFPACFAYGVEPGAGPSLIFITLPNVFNNMSGGRIWGAIFFLFMSFASLSTVIAIFQNLTSFLIDLKGYSLKKSILINFVIVLITSLLCPLGFNVLSSFQPFGAGSTILDLEDFILSNNLLPLGSLVYVIFCTSRYGWGFEKFIEEANTGKGIKFPKWVKVYLKYFLPAIILIIFVQGYISKFF